MEFVHPPVTSTLTQDEHDALFQQFFDLFPPLVQPIQQSDNIGEEDQSLSQLYENK